MKDSTFTYAFLYIRIAMAMISMFVDSEDEAIQILKDFSIMILILILIVFHYQDQPFTNPRIQIISGGILLWTWVLSLCAITFQLFPLSEYLDRSIVYLLSLPICFKFQSVFTQRHIYSLFTNYSKSFKSPSKFFTMMHTLIPY